MGKIIEPEALQGKYVNLREVTLDDAPFILSLRTDEKRARFLHKTENNLEKQINYLKHYFNLGEEWYFIIENKKHNPLGTIRIYNVNFPCFTGGSWIMKKESTSQESFEGDLILKKYAFEILGFKESIFDVRKENTKLIRYHKFCGAKIIDKTSTDFIFKFTKDNYLLKKDLLLSMLG